MDQDKHKPIFSAKELRTKSKMAFPNGIPNREQKIKLVREWQEMIHTGKADRKEEELKPIFIPLFFGEILGYDYKNAHKWHLRFENKSQTDSTKADAALGFFSIVPNPEDSENPQGLIKQDIRAVIEIKDSKDELKARGKNSAVSQAFSYVAKSGEKCKWVILSNFKEIHFYASHDASKFEKFVILELDQEDEFDRFYYLLANGQLFFEKNTSPVDTLLANRLELESSITQEFYEKYTHLREVFVQHLKLHNPNHAPLDLLQYAQTIIDRVIFVSVIKDYELIRYNTLKKVREISEESWASDQQELWRQLKYLFKALDKGIPKRIEAFNGGLFRHNPVIDELVIKDVFLKQLFELNQYDFESELNINILGHIFEQSITDIEKLKIELLQGKEVKYSETDEDIVFENAQNASGLRKKDGIFYTPEYVTAYMIENSLGEWLEEQKEKIGLADESEDLAIWKRYAEILQGVKILDPACGSGAFLTQTFDFLFAEWTFVFTAVKKLKEQNLDKKGIFSKTFTQIKKDIISNNLFGVDLNYESVEITKLGLWLKSASKSDPLALLDDNIKVGNSLISDPAVSEKAFDWEKEFAEIMQNGGFDLIVGNPPYVVKSPDELKNFQFVKGNYNTYIAFFERAFGLLKKESAVLSFIVPTTFFSGANYEAFRNHLLDNYDILQIIQLPYDVFEAYIDTAIIMISSKRKRKTTKIYRFDVKADRERIKNLNYLQFPTEKWKEYGKIFLNTQILSIGNKFWFSPNNVLLGQVTKVQRGCLPPQNEELSIKKTEKHNLLWFANQVFRYHVEKKSANLYVDHSTLKESKDLHFFQCPKILARQLVSRQFRINMTYTEETFAFKKNLYGIYDPVAGFDLKYILAVLNSKLFSFCQINFNTSLQRDDFPAFSLHDFRNFPIPIITMDKQQIFVDKVQKIMQAKEDLQVFSSKFFKTLKANFDLSKISAKMENWYQISEKEFLAELEKQEIKISMSKQEELFEFLDEQKEKALLIRDLIENLDEEIDQLVYQVYDLTEEEIKIVENG